MSPFSDVLLLRPATFRTRVDPLFFDPVTPLDPGKRNLEDIEQFGPVRFRDVSVPAVMILFPRKLDMTPIGPPLAKERHVVIPASA